MDRKVVRLALFTVLILVAAMAFAQSGNQVANGPTAKASVPTSPLVDLNTASKKSLMELPGMTDAVALKIIANRPYHAKAELTEKKLLPKDLYDKIAARIVARTATRVSPGNVEKKAASSKGQSEVKRNYN